LDEGSQWYWIVMAGAGMGLMVGPSNTDAINRAPRTSYGEATGITQTVRNYGSALGLAVLGTVLINANATSIPAALAAAQVPAPVAAEVAADFTSGTRPPASSSADDSPEGRAIQAGIEEGFAVSTQRVLRLMAALMAVACAIALVGLRAGRQEELVEAPDAVAPG
jgi:hypothetical protein